MGHLLRNAGYQNIQERAHVLHASAEMEAHYSFYRNFEVAYSLAAPFLIKLKLTTQEAFDDLHRQAMAELLSDNFCATWFYMTVWAEKP